MSNTSNFCIPIPKNAPKQGWELSPWGMFTRAANQSKGTAGAKFVLNHLLSQGRTAKLISSKGDILDNGDKAEVKTGLLRVTGNGEQSLWWNQIRPLEMEWKHLYLVGFYPTKVEIWKVEREKAIEFAKASKTLDHAGQGVQKALLAIGVKKNARTNTFPLLSKYGTLLRTLNPNEICVEEPDDEEAN